MNDQTQITTTHPVKSFIEATQKAMSNVLPGHNPDSEVEALTFDDILVHMRLKLLIKLGVENCSESRWRRALCYLAHGNEACGSQKFTSLKESAKSAMQQIEDQSRKEVRVYAEEWGGKGGDCVYFSFKMDRTKLQIHLSVRFRVPVPSLSSRLQEEYRTGSYKNRTEELKRLVMEELGVQNVD